MAQLQEKLVDYIEDAYAMEESAAKMLDSMISSTQDPRIRGDLENHKEKTERHLDRLDGCLRTYGTSPSTGKDIGSKAVGWVKEITDQMRGDKPGKLGRDGYVTVQMEI